jgi:hypothetical protein
MKRNCIILFLWIYVVVSSNTFAAQSYSANHEKVTKLFQSNQEKTAKDAIWTTQNIFKIGVFDDASSRNGYARYVCSVLYDYGFKGKRVWVQIIDIIELTKNGKWVKLGEARCK